MSENSVIQFKSLCDKELYEYDACSLLQELVFFNSQYPDQGVVYDLEHLIKCLKKDLELKDDVL